jgi:transcriptional regulator with XRE-family HTH domain
VPRPDPLLARNLRLVRQAAKLSRREVASAAGISLSSVEKLELAYWRPSPRTLRAVARALGVSVEYLGRELIPPPQAQPHLALARVIREGRDAAGLSTADMARAAGISPPYAWNILGGRKIPPPATLRALARAVGLPPRRLRAAAASWKPPPVAGVIRELRAAAGRTRAEAAAAAGITQDHFAALERGQAVPSAETIRGLVRGLRANPSAIVAAMEGPARHRRRP